MHSGRFSIAFWCQHFDTLASIFDESQLVPFIRTPRGAEITSL
jgi:hypothetical protein